MKKNFYTTVLFCLLSSSTIQAEDELPFKIDYYQHNLNDPLTLYANIRALYGEGIESNTEGRTREDNEQLRLGIRYQRDLPYNWFFKGDIRGIFQHRQEKNDINTDEIWDAHFEVRELYLENKPLFEDLPFGFLGGRKQFRDDRGWWYDNQLDVVQLQYHSTQLNAEFSYGGRLIDERVVSETQNIGFEDSEFFIGHIDYQFYYQHHLQAYAIYQNDDFSNNNIGDVFDINSNLNSEIDLFWVGVRFNGLFSLADRSSLKYWADFATVNGSERDFITSNISSSDRTITDIRNINVNNAYGLDIGTAWKSADDSWGLAVNYAFGSGDNDGSSGQSSYRQPTIANNKSRLFGESRDRIYGELLRPELSNIQLLSISAGRRLNEYLWLQGSYFHYWQIEASTDFDASVLSIAPNGTNKDLGNELDLILMATWSNHLNAQFTLSGFYAGSAFDHVAQSKFAYKGLLEFKFNW